MSDLFREEVVKARFEEIGVPLKVSSQWMRVYSLSLAIVVAALIFLVWQGSYSRKASVSGFLVPSQGLLKVFTPREGRVISTKVVEGQYVEKGEPLFVVGVGIGSTTGSTIEAVEANLNNRLKLIHDELFRLEKAQISELDGIAAQISLTQRKLQIIKAELRQRQDDTELAASNVKRHTLLQQHEFSSPLLLEQAKRSLVSSELAQLEQKRLLLETTGEVQRLKERKAELTYRHTNERSRLQRELAELNKQIVELVDEREITTRAPVSGTVTRLTAIVGSTVSDKTPMVTLVPDGSHLEAYIYAPSNAVGFVKPGSEVLLRYEAFPYQKFGQQKAYVSTISQTSVSSKELPFEVPSNEPLYVIVAKLEKDQISIGNKNYPLQVGAKFIASLILEDRKIWEWIIGPLLTFKTTS